jgi:hypothetical protein
MAKTDCHAGLQQEKGRTLLTIKSLCEHLWDRQPNAAWNAVTENLTLTGRGAAWWKDF